MEANYARNPATAQLGLLIVNEEVKESIYIGVDLWHTEINHISGFNPKCLC